MKRLVVMSGLVFGMVFTVLSMVLPMTVTQADSMANQGAPNQIHIDSNLQVATFAGGCFWCVEAAFEKVPGVAEVVSGYTGGAEDSPSYRQVASGETGHTEAVQVFFDDTKITYEGLLEVLWRTANPTDITGQYVDRGRQYRPEIFFHDESQQNAAIKSKKALDDSGRYSDPVLIAITPASEFYAAEDYHQDYYKKNPIRYKVYTRNSGRYQFIESVWPEGRDINFDDFRPEMAEDAKPVGNAVTTIDSITTPSNALSSSTADFDITAFVKPSDAELKKRLSAIEYKVTQKDGTERAFSNSMHKEKRDGLYVDIVSGEPLFSSSDKYDSKTGWPSFRRAIAENVVIEKEDNSLFSMRTEIRSAVADSHLGHVFNDGPTPTGRRYCMNAAAMRFIPVDQLAAAGYSAYIDRVVSGMVGS